MGDPICAALANADPAISFAALDDLVQQRVGARLVTVMAFDATTGESARVFTNSPEVYPVGGRKPLPANRWTDLVIRNRRDWVANSMPEISEMLFDHDVIASLGCGSCLNMVLVAGDQVMGTLNLLDVEGHFTPDRLTAAETLRLPALAALLRARLI